jgi:hypothetical protein
LGQARALIGRNSVLLSKRVILIRRGCTVSRVYRRTHALSGIRVIGRAMPLLGQMPVPRFPTLAYPIDHQAPRRGHLRCLSALGRV